VNTAKPAETFAPTNSAENYIMCTFPAPMSTDFMLCHKSTLRLAQYLMNYSTQSKETLHAYGYGLKWYCDFIGKTPDDIIAECLDKDGDPDQKAAARVSQLLDVFVGHLKSRNLSPGTVYCYVKSIRTFYRANGIVVNLPHPLPRWTIASGRSPTPDELQRLVDMADLREKVIVSMLALGGFRVGTLAKLQYKHVKHDLEAGIVPLHVHVEVSIMKGKYCEHDTFVGKEAVDYLKAYLDQRRRGTAKMPPEVIDEKSPLIRGKYAANVGLLNPISLSSIVKNLYIRAGLIGERNGPRHELVTHSLRKFFRTQLGACIPSDYVEYMMGHRGNVYNDIHSKGIEFLRGLYANANFSLRPRTTLSELDTLKTLIRSWGKDPEAYLSKEAMNMSHRAYIGLSSDNPQLNILRGYLRQLIKNDQEQGGCL